MENLITELKLLASDPRAWIAVAGLGLVAVHSVVHYLRCPILHQIRDVTPEEARKAVHAAHVHSPRFLLLMLAGIGLALAGLALIAQGINAPLALGMLAGGLFLVTTEPLRLNIRDRRLRVVASKIEGETACSVAIGRLREEYRNLIITNAVLTGAVALYLIAF